MSRGAIRIFGNSPHLDLGDQATNRPVTTYIEEEVGIKHRQNTDYPTVGDQSSLQFSFSPTSAASRRVHWPGQTVPQHMQQTE